MGAALALLLVIIFILTLSVYSIISNLKKPIETAPIDSNIKKISELSALAPSPQLPCDGSETADFDAEHMTVNEIYAYIDKVVEKYPDYITKQTMGKEYSGTYDCNRYILCDGTYKAWVKKDCPKMYAWANGGTILYSVSISPRVGDTMYSSADLTASAGEVSRVNYDKKGLKASTRTVDSVIYSRSPENDVDPTIVFTNGLGEKGSAVLNNTLEDYSTVSSLNGSSLTDANGNEYERYPFEDRLSDTTKPLKYFILANEHGGKSFDDPRISAVVVSRMIKDLCEGTENEFLSWLKENVCLTVIPVGNPWGFSKNEREGYYVAHVDPETLNNTADGRININRNYDTPGWYKGVGGNGDGIGSYPCSEIETQYIEDTIMLSNADAGMSVHTLGTIGNDYLVHYQGNGFDPNGIEEISEIMEATYNLTTESYGTGKDQDPYHSAKSCSFLQYSGIYGGLIEMNNRNGNDSSIRNDSVSAEAAYTQLLLYIKEWLSQSPRGQTWANKGY